LRLTLSIPPNWGLRGDVAAAKADVYVPQLWNVNYR
jgi:hypothetical protein